VTARHHARYPFEFSKPSVSPRKWGAIPSRTERAKSRGNCDVSAAMLERQFQNVSSPSPSPRPPHEQPIVMDDAHARGDGNGWGRLWALEVDVASETTSVYNAFGSGPATERARAAIWQSVR